MNYLGQPIELIEQPSGWLGIWFHPCCIIELGYFPTAQSAWDAVTELVRRDVAGRSLLPLIQEWRDQDLIDYREQDWLEASLFQFVSEEG